MRILYHPRKLARVKYGLLYNWYAATDVRNIAPAGWHVPTKTEFETLITNIGGTIGGSAKLKENNNIYWNPLTGNENNLYNFNFRGAGGRETYTGEFGGLQLGGICWSTTILESAPDDQSYMLSAYSENDDVQMEWNWKDMGFSLRLLKDNTTDTGTMTGNDGKVYPTVTIGTQVWMAANLAETEYRNGNVIPEVTDNSAWISLTSGALCAYNNDWGNV